MQLPGFMEVKEFPLMHSSLGKVIVFKYLVLRLSYEFFACCQEVVEHRNCILVHTFNQLPQTETVFYFYPTFIHCEWSQ